MSGTGSDSEAGIGAAAALSAASRERADAFLAEQTHLARLAIAREIRDERLRGRHQVIEHLSGLMKLAFETAVALAVVGIGVALAAALWSASHANGLVIEAFSVPPDLAARGLTGEVVAGKVLDRLSALQAATQSNRAQSSYVNNWGNDIKVQIPETGVSIGQLYQYLVRWLGSETHISGDIYRDNLGLAVTSRVGGDSSETLHGSDARLDDLVTRAAESVYRRTQPYRFAVYLDSRKRTAEAQAIYGALIAGSNLDDRAWAYIGLSSERSIAADLPGADALLRRAIAIKPGILLAYENLANNEATLQHDEAQLYWLKKAMAVEAQGRDPSMNAEDFAVNQLQDKANLAGVLGDFVTELAYTRQVLALPVGSGNAANAPNRRAAELPICAALHDRACFDDVLSQLPPAEGVIVRLNRIAAIQLAYSQFEDWDGVLKDANFLVGEIAKLGTLGRNFLVRGEYPLLALAYAHKGNWKAAHDAIEQGPLDCIICLRVRGRLASLAHDGPAADRWYALAVRDAPSGPFSLTEWGESLLRRGDLAGAIAKFAAAHAQGPRYADALELWGEALIADNRSDLALAKFEEAARYAPNWGRLHLKWAQALLYAGRPDDAKRQFALAAAMDLSPADRARLPH